MNSMFKGSKQIIPELSSEFLFIQSSVFVIVRVFDKIFVINVLFYELKGPVDIIISLHYLYTTQNLLSIRLNIF